MAFEATGCLETWDIEWGNRVELHHSRTSVRFQPQMWQQICKTWWLTWQIHDSKDAIEPERSYFMMAGVLFPLSTNDLLGIPSIYIYIYIYITIFTVKTQWQVFYSLSVSFLVFATAIVPVCWGWWDPVGPACWQRGETAGRWSIFQAEKDKWWNACRLRLQCKLWTAETSNRKLSSKLSQKLSASLQPGRPTGRWRQFRWDSGEQHFFGARDAWEFDGVWFSKVWS